MIESNLKEEYRIPLPSIRKGSVVPVRVHTPVRKLPKMQQIPMPLCATSYPTPC